MISVKKILYKIFNIKEQYISNLYLANNRISIRTTDSLKTITSPNYIKEEDLLNLILNNEIIKIYYDYKDENDCKLGIFKVYKEQYNFSDKFKSITLVHVKDIL